MTHNKANDRAAQVKVSTCIKLAAKAVDIVY
jgi:hypothetical protein